MRGRILLRGAEFGRGATTDIGTVRKENRVVAEPALTARFPDDRARPFTAHDDFTGRGDQRAGRYERRAAPAVGHVTQLRQQQCGVGGVVAVVTGPTRREDAGHAAQRIHRQTGVVGHARQTRRGERVARFGQRVFLEGRTGFRRLVERRHIVERHQRQPRQSGSVEYPA